MTDEDLLRSRLRAAVPEPPAAVTLAGPVLTRARAARRRRVAASVVGAAAAVAVVVGVTAALAPDPVRTVPAGGQGVARPGPDPYATDPCPAAMQLRYSASKPVTGVVHSARFCAYDRGRPTSVPQDALVTDLAAFIDDAGALPAADPDRCATVDAVAPSTAVVITVGDGTRRVVPIGYCSDVTFGGRSVRSEQVQTLLLSALDAQRTRLGVSGNRTSPWADDLCRVTPAPAPLDPVRDAVIAGSVCRVGATPRPSRIRQLPMSAATLARVRAAWAHATPLPAGSAVCSVGFLTSYRVLTAAGDVFTLGSSCGTVVVNELSGRWVYDVPLPGDDPLQRPWADSGGTPG